MGGRQIKKSTLDFQFITRIALRVKIDSVTENKIGRKEKSKV